MTSKNESESKQVDKPKSCQHQAETSCDNDCGTFTCKLCRNEYYKKDQEYVLGHCPDCGQLPEGFNDVFDTMPESKKVKS